MKQPGIVGLALALSLAMLTHCAQPSSSGGLGVPDTPPGPGGDPKDPGPGGPGGDPKNPGGGGPTSSTHGTRLDDWHIGNGGDHLRKHILDSKKLTRKILSKIRPRALSEQNPKHAAVKPFVIKYSKQIAYDIDVSQFRYFEKGKDTHTQDTCAYTWPKQGMPIVLKYDICKTSLGNGRDTAWLILHEIAHHFQNLPDVAPIVGSMPGDSPQAQQEEFADAVAEIILDAWTSGRTEWEKISLENAPAPRTQHSAVWTDRSLAGKDAGAHFANSMIIWGGLGSVDPSRPQRDPIATGAAYNADKDSWLEISANGAPAARYGHDAVWTGSKMIVWGGYGERSALFDGGVWDAKTNSWELIKYPYPVASFGPGSELQVQTLTLISATEVLIYGASTKGPEEEGEATLGAIYNFAEKDPAKRWKPINGTPGVAGAMMSRGGHTTTFVGKDKIFVFGGIDRTGEKTAASALYDFRKNTWEAIAPDPQLLPRAGHKAVYSSHGVIIFGMHRKRGGREHLHGSGAYYNVHSNAKDKWTLIAAQSAPERRDHTMVWTGTEMMVFGGKAITGRGTLYSSISKFNPSNLGWSSVSSNYHGPELVHGHTAVWTGYSMIVWGGQTRTENPRPQHSVLNKGFVYYP